MRATVARLGVLEECVVIVVAESLNSPHVAPSEQVRVEEPGSRAGVALVTARFGFPDAQDVPAALQRALAAGLGCEADLDHTSYFLSRTRIAVTDAPGRAQWRKRLFVVMTHTAVDPADAMSLPGERTVVITSQVTL
jgi:KUP system potassium uptake protein